MRPGLLLAVLLAACASRTPDRYGPDLDVHLILRLEPPPREPKLVRPVVEVGPRSLDCPPQTLDADVAAAEIAVLSVPAGEHPLVIRFGNRLFRLRGFLTVERETWVVLTLKQGGDKSIETFDAPPHDEIGAWRPFAALPD